MRRRRSGQWANRVHANVMAAAIAVSAAAAIPTLGWISWARMSEDIASTNQPKILSQRIGVDHRGQTGADESTRHGRGRYRQVPPSS